MNFHFNIAKNTYTNFELTCTTSNLFRNNPSTKAIIAYNISAPADPDIGAMLLNSQLRSNKSDTIPMVMITMVIPEDEGIFTEDAHYIVKTICQEYIQEFDCIYRIEEINNGTRVYLFIADVSNYNINYRLSDTIIYNISELMNTIETIHDEYIDAVS